MPRKDAICRIIIFLSVVLFSSFHSTSAHSASLRLWVMPNEAVKDHGPVSIREMDKFLKETASKGIIIENDIKGMLRTGYPDWTTEFISNIMQQDVLLQQLEDFIKAEPGIDKIYVEFLRWIDSYHRYSALANEGLPIDPPDVIQMGSTWTAAFADKGFLLPLNSYREFLDFFPGALASCRILGENDIYAVPWFIDTRLIFYWKKHFPNGEGSFATWESLKEALGKVKGADPFAIGLGPTWNLMHNLAPWVWGAGGEFAEETVIPHLYHAPWEKDDFKEAIRYIHSLVADDLLDLPDVSMDKVELDFIGGKNASILAVPHLIHRLPHDWPMDIGTALPPAGPDGQYTFLGGSHLAITRFAEQNKAVDKSVSLVNYLTSPQNGVQYAMGTGFLPPLEASIDLYVAMRPELSVFKGALKAGKSYPSIPEWGEIFENEITRTHLFNLWNDIALGKPLPVVLATLSDISNQINKRLIQKAMAKYSLPVGIILTITLAALVISIVLWRKKQSYFLGKLETLGNQLRTLEGQKIVLEGQIALLEKHGGTQANELQRSREKLISLGSQIDDLTDKFEQIRAKRYKSATLPKFHIRSDGTVTINGSEVAFENKRQAKHLIEYIVRHTNHKQTSIHCIKGFILFDWTNLREDSNPKRVFDTVASKINMPLKKAGLPPILISSGRESWQWNVSWDPKLLEQNTDTMNARKLGNDARECFYTGDFEDAAEKMAGCLRMDPKCIEALSVLQEFQIEGLNISQARLSSLKDLKRISDQILQKSSSQHSTGLAMAKKHIENLKRLSKAGLAGRLESEIGTLEAEIDCEKRTISNLFAGGTGQPLYLKEINDQLLCIWRNINELKGKGLNNCDIWAQITQDKYFLTLLSNPQLNDLIHNFYDHATKATEDPRLVKLAMILMLNGDECIKELEDTFDGKAFFKTIEKHLRKQFRRLEQEISQFQIN